MTTIRDAYINALLADATYALKEDAESGYTGAQLKDLDALKTRMTPTLANFIGNNFSAVTHIDTSDNPLVGSGFDATVWRGIDGEYAGKTYVTFTGSEDVSDFAGADLDLTISGAATRQIVDMVNWWLKNKTPAGQLAKQITLNTGTFELTNSVVGTGILNDVSNVIVNGHSLGGHLAAAFARLFGNQVNVEHVYTFNSAGFTLNSNNIFSQIEALLGSGISKGLFQENKQTNFYAENGLNVTTRDLENIQLGDRQGLFNEESTGLPNHYMYKLTDSLALSNALSKLTGTNDLATINLLFEMGSNRTEASLEMILDGLRKTILGVQAVKTPIGDIEDSALSRLSFYQNLDELQNSAAFLSLMGKVRLDTQPVKEIIGPREFNFGEFLSLYYLTPFIIRGLNSDENANPALKALWESSQSEGISQMWLADRAAMLSWLNKRNLNDSGLVVPSTGIKQAFEDKATSTLLLTGDGEIFNRNQYIFGGDGVDQISGGDKADHLYGMAGNDIVNGGGGNDYLEGNYGDDSLKGGMGNDSIYGGNGADTLNGDDGADALRGENGNDNLYGGNGSDTLIGGQGKDYLNGGLGDDFYLVDDGDIIEDSDGKGKIVMGNSTDSLIFKSPFKGASKVNGQSYYEDLNVGVRYQYAGADLLITDTSSSKVVVKNFKNGDLGINLIEETFYQSGINANVPSASNNGVEVVVNDFVNGTDYNDKITNGTSGFDQIFAGSGIDEISTGAVSITSKLEGGDLIDAGAGDDYLWLMGTNNTVIVNANSGSDTITLNPANIGLWSDFQKTYVGAATLNLNLNGINSNDVVISKDAEATSNYYAQYTDQRNASLYIKTTGQSLKIFSVDDFNLNITYSNKVASINTTALTTFQINGTKNSDEVFTRNNNGVNLFGYEGNDQVYGAEGNDVLDGGAGNDVLGGGFGNDIYQFGIGYGLDYVQDEIGQNTIKFLNGISPESVVVEKNSDSRLVFHLNTEDILSVSNFKNISNVIFADGTIWEKKDFSEPYYAGDDQINGTNTSDTIYGYLGDDNIDANQGDDVISGGKGADTLSGGLGSDTYLFNLGDGADTISEFSDSSTDFDIVQLGTGISSSDIKGIRAGQDLILKIGNNEDQITIKDWYQSNSYRIEQIKFVDEPNVSWDVAKIEAITNTPPTALPLTLTMNEDTSKVITPSDFGFSDEDLDNSLQSVKITSLSGGSLKLNGVAVIANQAITAANISSGLLTYTPSLNMNGGMLIGFKVSDGKTWSVSESFLAINVVAVNDAPTAISMSALEKYAENVALNLTDIVIMDVDSNVHGVSLMLSNPAAGTLSTGTFGGVTSTYNVMFGIGYWNAFGATESVNALLAGLTFTPTANYTGSFTIATSVSDGVSAEVTGIKSFSLANSEPTITNMSASEGYTEDIALNLVDMVITDSDSTTHTVTLTLSNVAAGALNTATSGGVSSTYNAATGVWTASGATASVNALLAGLTFTPAANANGNFTIATSISDGVNTVTGSKSFTGTALNDAPTAANATITTNEDTAKVFALSDFGFSDVDAGNTLQSVTITTLPSAGSLRLNGTAVTANQVITAANISSGLLTFTPAANANGTGYASIGFKVSDGAAVSASAYTLTMNVTAVNDAPTTTNLAASETYTKNVALNLKDIVITDIDSATHTVTLTLSTVAAGILNTATSGAVTSTYNATTGVWTASGATANVNALLAGLTFTPTANYTGSFTIATSVSDGVAAAVTGTKSFSAAANVAPTITNINASESYTEDIALNLVDMVITDSDSTTHTATLTLSNVAAGALNTATSGSVTSTYNAATGVWTASGATASVNALLAGLTFTPAANANGNFTIATSISDGVNTVTGSKSFTGIAVNDAPTATNATITTNEDTAKVFALSDFGFGDVDAGNTLQSVTITTLSSAGNLRLNGTAVTANQVITAANISSGLLTFTPTANANGVAYANIGFKVSDGTVVSAAANTLTINVTAVNDAPTAANVTLTTNEDTAKVFALSDFGFSDVDAGNTLQSVTITTLPGAGNLRLNGTAVTANQVITAANISSGLLTFTPAANANGAAYASIGFKVSDGTAVSAAAYTLTMNVTAVNDAPTGTNATITTNEDTAKIFALSDFGFSDVDAGNILQSVTITTLAGAGNLRLNGTAVTANQVITAANISSGLLTFTPAANANGAAYASIGFKVSDGTAVSAAAYTLTMNVTAVNDAPTATNLAASEVYTKNVALNLNDIVITDIDSATHTATLTLSNVAAGTLNTATSGAVTSTYNATTGVWTASGATANVNALLAGLTFTPTANYTGSFTIATSVSDGVAAAVTGTKSFSAAANVAPTITNINASESYTEDVALNLVDMVITDSDSTTHTATLTLSNVAAGALNTATSGSVTSSYNAATGVWTASGATASVNALLAGLTFTPAANANGNFTIATSISDGVNTVTGSKSFTGIAVNDAPTATNATITTNEDTAKVFALSDFGFSDVDAGNTLQSVTITTLPGAGSLLLNGAAVTANQVITAANISSGLLTFTPAANANGAAYASIGFKVSDGTAVSAAAYTLTMNVTAVNDAPTATNLAASEVYTKNVALNLNDIVITDIDSATHTATLTLSTVAAGSLNTATSGAVTSTYNASTGVWSASGATANVNALLAGLTFTPTANYTGSFMIATSVSDGLNTVTGSKSFSGSALNSAPTATNLNVAEKYLQNSDLATSLTDIVITDPDGGPITVSLTMSQSWYGSFNTSTFGATTSVFNSSTGVWSATGSVADLNGLLAGLTFTRGSGVASTFDVAVLISDGIAPSITGTKTFSPSVYGSEMDDIMWSPIQGGGIYGYGGNDQITGSYSQDQMYGGDGNDRLWGNGDDDYLNGGNGNDNLDDTTGNGILQGMAGDDILIDTYSYSYADNKLFDGGDGNDVITADSTSKDIFIGGKGADNITTGNGYDVILFNKGDGADTVNASLNTDNTLSLGGNFAYSDLSLTKSTNDLILKMGTSDQIILKGWYDTSANNKSVLNMQVIAEAMQGFSLGGSDALRNNKVETFNFANLVSAFDAAGATANWQLTNARLTAHLSSGSDTSAIGGDIAYQYGKNGSLTGVGLLAAQSVINNANVGQSAQTLNAASSWAAETIKLS